jgi:hypothetical protein
MVQAMVADLPEPGDAEQRLEPLALVDRLAERGDRRGLVARRLELRHDAESCVVVRRVVARRRGFEQEVLGGEWRTRCGSFGHPHSLHANMRSVIGRARPRRTVAVWTWRR